MWQVWGEEKCIQVLVGKPEGKRQLVRSRSRWEDNFKIDLQEVLCGVMDWIELAQDRSSWRAIVNAAMNFWFPKMPEISSLDKKRLASQVGVLQGVSVFNVTLV